MADLESALWQVKSVPFFDFTECQMQPCCLRLPSISSSNLWKGHKARVNACRLVCLDPEGMEKLRLG